MLAEYRGLALPETVDEALAALAERPGARIIAGGTELMPDLLVGKVRAERVRLAAPRPRASRDPPRRRRLDDRRDDPDRRPGRRPDRRAGAGSRPRGREPRHAPGAKPRHDRRQRRSARSRSGTCCPPCSRSKRRSTSPRPAGFAPSPIAASRSGPARRSARPDELVVAIRVPVLEGSRATSRSAAATRSSSPPRASPSSSIARPARCDWASGTPRRPRSGPRRRRRSRRPASTGRTGRCPRGRRGVRAARGGLGRTSRRLHRQRRLPPPRRRRARPAAADARLPRGLRWRMRSASATS